MRYLKIAILTAIFAAVALVVSAEDVGAVEVEVASDGFEDMRIGDTLQIYTTFKLEEGDPSGGVTRTHLQLSGGYPWHITGRGQQIGVPWTQSYDFLDENAHFIVPRTVNQSLYQTCQDTGFAPFTVRVESHSGVEFLQSGSQHPLLC